MVPNSKPSGQLCLDAHRRSRGSTLSSVRFGFWGLVVRDLEFRVYFGVNMGTRVVAPVRDSSAKYSTYVWDGLLQGFVPAAPRSYCFSGFLSKVLADCHSLRRSPGPSPHRPSSTSLAMGFLCPVCSLHLTTIYPFPEVRILRTKHVVYSLQDQSVEQHRNVSENQVSRI